MISKMTSSKVAVSFGEGKHSDSVYVEAKQEYTIRLITLMEKQFFRIFEQEYDRVFAEIQTDDEILERFQDRLMKISEWNQIYVDDLYDRFLREENCKDWYDQLIGAVFVANIRVMASIRTRAPKETLQIDIPRGNYFFHHSLIQVARNMYYKPYLFYQMRNDDDMMSDKTTGIFTMIYQGIESSIRILLPVNSLMNSYLPLQNEPTENGKNEKEENEKEENEKEENEKEENEKEENEKEENESDGEEETDAYALPSVSLDNEKEEEEEEEEDDESGIEEEDDESVIEEGIEEPMNHDAEEEDEVEVGSPIASSSGMLEETNEIEELENRIIEAPILPSQEETKIDESHSAKEIHLGDLPLNQARYKMIRPHLISEEQVARERQQQQQEKEMKEENQEEKTERKGFFLESEESDEEEEGFFSRG
jgi:hypothetical protein